MDSSNMILHVIQAAEDPPASLPRTPDGWTVLCLVSRAVFFLLANQRLVLRALTSDTGAVASPVTGRVDVHVLVVTVASAAGKDDGSASAAVAERGHPGTRQ